jgi:adenine/guanine/hypoxanthine permease
MTRADHRTECLAGVTTFFTMAYIVVVNPSILSTEGTGMPFSGVLTATVVLSFLMTLLMGVYADLPFGVAPGMGINAFFTFTLILGKGVPWPTALGMTFWAGVLFLLASITNLRTAIAHAIPHGLRIGAAAGIGLFLTFIGLKNAGIVVASPATFVTLGKVDSKVLLSVAGLFIVLALSRKKNPFAFLAAIGVVTVLALILGKVQAPPSFFSAPDFGSVLFKLDIWSALKLSLVPAILAILLTDLFDSISTFIGVSQASGMVDEKGEPKNLHKGLIVDAWATLGAGLLGTSSGTAYIESAAGVEVGGRTGWTAVYTALCFLPCLFIAPLAGMVPGYATAPVLIYVGSLMFRSVTELKMKTVEDSFPVFLTVILIPLTFSITQGILWGFIAHAVLYLLAGRGKEVSPILYALAGVAVGLLWMESA